MSSKDASTRLVSLQKTNLLPAETSVLGNFWQLPKHVFHTAKQTICVSIDGNPVATRNVDKFLLHLPCYIQLAHFQKHRAKMFKWIRTKDLGFHPPTASESLKGTRYLSWLHCLCHKGQKLQRSFHQWWNSPTTKVTWQFRSLAVNKCSKCTRDSCSN